MNVNYSNALNPREILFEVQNNVKNVKCKDKLENAFFVFKIQMNTFLENVLPIYAAGLSPERIFLFASTDIFESIKVLSNEMTSLTQKIDNNNTKNKNSEVLTRYFLSKFSSIGPNEQIEELKNQYIISIEKIQDILKNILSDKLEDNDKVYAEV